MVYLDAAALIAILVLILYYRSVSGRTEDKFIRLPERISQELLEFLEKADDAYILTHQTVEIRHFSPYASTAVCHEVLEAIYKNPGKMFGTLRCRRRTWSVLSQEKDNYVLRKEISHRPVKVKGINITLGDDMLEFWKISRNAKGFLVEDVW